MALAATSSRRRQAIDIDFLQSSAQSRYTLEQILFMVLMGCCVIGIAWIGWLWHEAKAGIAQADQRLAAVTTQISATEQAASNAKPKVNIAGLLGLPEAILSSKADAGAVLKRLTELLPVEANISSLAFGEAGSVKLNGLFASTEHVITFMRGIQESEDFSMLRMGVMSKSPIPSDDKLQPAIQVEFELSYQPKPARKEGNKP
jgi:Tfp pilus assembly protein PilN